jgi:universal stress protein E
MRLLTLRRVLVASGLDADSAGVTEAGVRLARAAGARLHVVHVLPAAAVALGAETSRAEALARARAALAGTGMKEHEAQIHLPTGRRSPAIRSVADEISADVIVVGPPKDRTWRQEDRATGNTAYAVASRAFAPCLVVDAPIRLPLERILVPVDLSDTARGALMTGLSWASGLRVRSAGAEGTSLTALHVQTARAATGGEQEDGEAIARELEIVREQAGDWAGVAVHGRTTRSDDVVSAIVRMASEVEPDLVVLGTRGVGLDQAERLGSVSVAVLERLHAPMLLVPPAVWRTHAGEA